MSIFVEGKPDDTILVVSEGAVERETQVPWRMLAALLFGGVSAGQ